MKFHYLGKGVFNGLQIVFGNGHQRLRNRGGADVCQLLLLGEAVVGVYKISLILVVPWRIELFMVPGDEKKEDPQYQAGEEDDEEDQDGILQVV